MLFTIQIDKIVADLLGGCVLRCVAVQAGATAGSVGWYGSCREVVPAAAVVCKFCLASFSAPMPKGPRTRSRSTPRPSSYTLRTPSEALMSVPKMNTFLGQAVSW
jgi:hypothetical protein